MTLCACEVDAEPVFDSLSGTDDLNLVMWRWSPHRPDRVVLIDDEGRLSRDPV